MHPKLILTILLLFCCSLFNKTIAQSIQAQEDSIRLLIKNAEEDTTKANHFADIGKMYVYVDPPKSLELLHSALAFAKSIQYEKAISDIYIYLTSLHNVLGSHPDSTLLYTELLEEQTKKAGNEKYQRDVFWNYGMYYYNLGEFDQALEYLFLALEEFRKYKNTEQDQAKLLMSIGTILDGQSQFDDAKKYFKQSMELAKPGSSSQALVLHYLGVLYRKAYNDADSSLFFLNQAFDVAQQTNNMALVLYIMIEQGMCYDILQQYDKANELYTEAEKVIEDNNIGLLLGRVYEGLANHYFDRKMYRKSLDYCDKTLATVQDTSQYKFLVEIYHIQEQCYAALGDYKKAYEYQALYMAASDTLFNRESRADFKEMQTKYEVKEKDLENQLLKADNEISAKTLRSRTAIAVSAIAILLLLGAWSLLTYRINQQRKTENELLEKDLENKKTIEEQAAKLQVLYDYKNRLFANIAHELRTPLTLISNPIRSILNSGNVLRANQQQLQVADKNIRSLSSTIYQILDLAKRENTALNAQPIRFNINELVQFVANDFHSMAQFKSIAFHQPANSVSIPVVTDGEKLMIVIRNLLSNAFKFTEKGGEVSIQLMDLGSEVAISVQDSGKGIAQEDLYKIFDRHFQVNADNLPSEGGMGIGLAICKEYMNLLKGTVSAESQLEKGSIFTIRFPKKHAELTETRPEASAAFNALIAQNTSLETVQSIENIPTTISNITATNEVSTILIVEDNVDMSNYLSSILKDEHELFFTQDGKQALEFLSNQKPDLIISDYMMPNMNGLELLNSLREEQQFANIPFIMLTAQQAMDVKLDALRIGVDDYLTKPFDNRELVARVNNILTNQRIIKVEQETTDTTTSVVDGTNLENVAWLTELETAALKYVYNLDFTIYQLAEEMSMSYSHMFPKIKKLTGMTPNQYITELRFQEARKLLEAKKYGSVKAVAYSVGYKSVKYFSKNFKKRFGKNPSEYLM